MDRRHFSAGSLARSVYALRELARAATARVYQLWGARELAKWTGFPVHHLPI